MVERGGRAENVTLAATALALTLAAAAAVFGYGAWRRTSEIRAEMRRLAVSVDGALREIAQQKSHDATTLADLNAQVSREVERLAQTAAQRPEADGMPEPAEDAAKIQGDNIVPHPATRRVRREAATVEIPQKLLETQAIHRILAGGPLELSLQPIISITEGAATGFEVHAHLDLGDGQSIDVRRTDDLLRRAEQASFERLMVTASAEAARRRLGDGGAAMPLHVAISNALFDNETELAHLIDQIERYPMLANAIVLSLPAASAVHPACASLTATGFRFALEGWPEKPLPRKQVAAFRKLPAAELLDAAAGGRPGMDTRALAEAAAQAGLGVVATEVQSDEDAMALIDIGITTMCGPHFGGPRRLKPQDDGKISRLAGVRTPRDG